MLDWERVACGVLGVSVAVLCKGEFVFAEGYGRIESYLTAKVQACSQLEPTLRFKEPTKTRI